jgi:hypothetical protein
MIRKMQWVVEQVAKELNIPETEAARRIRLSFLPRQVRWDMVRANPDVLNEAISLCLAFQGFTVERGKIYVMRMLNKSVFKSVTIMLHKEDAPEIVVLQSTVIASLLKAHEKGIIQFPTDADAEDYDIIMNQTYLDLAEHSAVFAQQWGQLRALERKIETGDYLKMLE